MTQILEQQLTGIDGLLYFSSNSNSSGSVSINIMFDKGTDPDIAQVQVQNAIQAAIPRLPLQVQQQGVNVSKSNPDLLMIIGVYDTTDRATGIDVRRLDGEQPSVSDRSRIPGVGQVNVFGSQYSMRIWLDPAKLRSFNLMPSDVAAALQSQNARSGGGQVGGVPQPLNNCSTLQSPRNRGFKPRINSAISSSRTTRRARAC